MLQQRKSTEGSMYMRKISLFLPIFWSMAALWNTYRVLADLPQLKAQACWVTVGDILWLICGFALAINYWIMFIKGSKRTGVQSKAEKE